MADLSEVRIGSKLVLTVEVTHEDARKGRAHPFGVQGLFGVSLGQEAVWLDREIIEAAEHIPAPRIFKRGDWVKLNFSDPQSVRQNGIVLRLEQRTTVSLGSRVEVEVSWPDGQIHWYVPNDLEPDEAPE